MPYFKITVIKMNRPVMVVKYLKVESTSKPLIPFIGVSGLSKQSINPIYSALK